VSVRDGTRLAIPRVRSGSGRPRGFDHFGYGAADLEEDGRMGRTGFARSADRAECGFCFWVTFARGSGLLVRSQDCATVRAHGSCRPIGPSARLAPDERRAAKERPALDLLNRQLQWRAATWQKRVSVSNTVSSTVLRILGNLGLLLQVFRR
jgi:hypothetical protein